jgi:hypothetical protein
MIRLAGWALNGRLTLEHLRLQERDLKWLHLQGKP